LLYRLLLFPDIPTTLAKIIIIINTCRITVLVMQSLCGYSARLKVNVGQELSFSMRSRLGYSSELRDGEGN
jgi:hypothetical protein